jgi:metallo-beta-lactamase family protein
MKMTITLYGAAGEVTGSAYHVQTSRASVMVDFGLFQGREMASDANHVPRKLDVEKLDAVILTHAHLDHVGRLPLLLKRGYKGPIYATPASIEVAQLILEDAVSVQAQAQRIVSVSEPVEQLAPV